MSYAGTSTFEASIQVHFSKANVIFVVKPCWIQSYYNNVSQNSTLFIKALNAIVMYSTIAAHFYML